MPEGDTIFRVAVRLRSTLEGKRILDASSRGNVHNANSLSGEYVRSVEARGKHLLIHFDGGLTLHSHLGMTGSWHVYRPGETWKKPEHCGEPIQITRQGDLGRTTYFCPECQEMA